MSGAQRGRLAVGGLFALLLLYWFFRGVDLEGLGVPPWPGRKTSPGYLIGLVGATVLVYLLRAWRWGYLLSPLARVPFARPLLRDHGRVRVRHGRAPRGRDRASLPRLAPPSGVGLGGLRHHRPREDRRPPDGPLPARPLPLRAARARRADARSPPRPPPAGRALRGRGRPGGRARRCSRSTSTPRQALAFFDRLLRKLPSWLSWLGKPLAGILRSFSEGLAVLQAPPSTLLVIFGQSFLIWLLIDLGFHWTHLAFGLDLPFRATFLLVAFLTVGVAIPTPGMVGGFHAFYLIALHEAFGVPNDTAVAVGLTAHALSTLPGHRARPRLPRPRRHLPRPGGAR